MKWLALVCLQSPIALRTSICMDAQSDAVVKRAMLATMEQLKQAEHFIRQADAAGLRSIVTRLDEVIRTLQTLPQENSSVIPLKAWSFLLRGNALREQGTTASRTEALTAYDEALRLWDQLPPQDAPHYRNHRAKAWMNRGMTLLYAGGAAELTEAIKHFDQAIAVRRELATDEEPWIKFGLAAGWMNRGDAMTRLGGEANLQEAVSSYDEALRVMSTLPIQANPQFQQRVAVAYLNRGITLEAIGTPESLLQAKESFAHASKVLEAAPEVAKREQVLAAALMNWCGVCLNVSPDEASQVREVAQRAWELVQSTERQDLASAEIGIKARHAWCRAVAEMISQQIEAVGKPDEVLEATDVVEEGIEIIRHWQVEGVRQFADIGRDFFRFGARFYRVFQPQFFDEFLRENQDLERPA